jgi:uncharacterized protein (DUF2461 family)
MLLHNITTINHKTQAYIQIHCPSSYACVAWYSCQTL